MRDYYKPFIKGFKSTSVWNAFILNSMAVALAATTAIEARNYLEIQYKAIPEYEKAFIAFSIAFLTTLITYHLLHLLFGFGGGMLVNS